MSVNSRVVARYGRPEARFIDRLRRGRPTVSGVAGEMRRFGRPTNAVGGVHRRGWWAACVRRARARGGSLAVVQGHHHRPYTVLLCCVLSLSLSLVPSTVVRQARRRTPEHSRWGPCSQLFDRPRSTTTTHFRPAAFPPHRIPLPSTPRPLTFDLVSHPYMD